MVKALSEQAAVTDWPLRLLLTAATVAVIVLALLALRRGWRRRAHRQQWPALPPVPAPASATRSITGKYIGTVSRGDWLDRIVAGGAMARADVSTTAEGLLLDREGEEPLFVPAADLVDVGTAPGMLQKVFGRHGVLTVTWRWGGADVVSGIWFADPADQATVADWVRGLMDMEPEETATREGSA